MIDLLQYCASIAAPSTKVNSAFGLQPQSYIIRVGEPRPALPICSILSKPMRDLFPSKGSDVDCQSFGMFSILVVNPRDERNGLALKSCSGGLLSLYIYFDFCRLSGRHHTELVLIKPVGRVRRKKWKIFNHFCTPHFTFFALFICMLDTFSSLAPTLISHRRDFHVLQRASSRGILSAAWFINFFQDFYQLTIMDFTSTNQSSQRKHLSHYCLIIQDRLKVNRIMICSRSQTAKDVD